MYKWNGKLLGRFCFLHLYILPVVVLSIVELQLYSYIVLPSEICNKEGGIIGFLTAWAWTRLDKLAWALQILDFVTSKSLKNISTSQNLYWSHFKGDILLQDKWFRTVIWLDLVPSHNMLQAQTILLPKTYINETAKLINHIITR